MHTWNTINDMLLQPIDWKKPRDEQTGMHVVGRALVAVWRNDLNTPPLPEIVYGDLGFRVDDVERGTSMAQAYNHFGFLTRQQVLVWLKPELTGAPRICRYIPQLLEIARQREYRKSRELEAAGLTVR